MTSFVELPLVTEHAHRTVWLNPAQVGSVEPGSKPGTCWVTMVWGCRHNLAASQTAVAAALGVIFAARRPDDDIDLRDEVLENLNR